MEIGKFNEVSGDKEKDEQKEDIDNIDDIDDSDYTEDDVSYEAAEENDNNKLSEAREVSEKEDNVEEVDETTESIFDSIKEKFSNILDKFKNKKIDENEIDDEMNTSKNQILEIPESKEKNADTDKKIDNPWRVIMSPEEVKKYNDDHGVADIPIERLEGGRTPGEDAWDRRFGDKHYLNHDE